MAVNPQMLMGSFTGCLSRAKNMTRAKAICVVMATFSLALAAGRTCTAGVVTTGSIWDDGNDFYAGFTSDGTLGIDSGSLFTRFYSVVGYHPGCSGTATVNGAGSIWSFGQLYLGFSGVGNLSIQTGGQVSGDGILGWNPGSTTIATVTGLGSGWTAGTLTVGSSGSGTLNIQTGGQVSNTVCYLGSNAGSTGMVIVTGTGSNGNFGPLYVGLSGTGTLNVQAGGQVTIPGGNSILVAYNTGSAGSVTVNGVGSILSTTSTGNILVGGNGTGNLNIQAGGQVSDAFGWLGNAAGSTGTATVSGTGSIWTNSFSLGLGGLGSTLNIQAGGQVQITGSGGGLVLGESSGTSGTAIVTGVGSTLTDSSGLNVGMSGLGTLIIQKGGQVNIAGDSVLAYNAGSAGNVTVTGAGSSWTNGHGLYVGSNSSSSCKLIVADGGKVTGQGLTINNQSAVTLNVRGNGMLVLGNATTTGGVANNGKINFYADTSLTAGPYSPVTPYPGKTINWSGTGSYNAYGGTWNTSTHTFTASAVTPLSAGLFNNNPVSSGERMLFTDSGTGQQVGASFGSVAAGTNFSAGLMSQGELDGLAGTAGFYGTILSAWDFNTNFSGDQVLLSYDIGLGQQDLEVWHLSGGVWTQYTPDMLTYGSDGIASFTVTSFSGYAVTTPEPATLALLAVGGVGLLGTVIRRRKAGGCTRVCEGRRRV